MSSDWPLVPLGELVDFRTGKLDSNAAVENAEYPFFTCSPTTLSIDNYAFDTEAVLLAGNNANGIFPVKYYHGKFNAYQRTYVIEPKDRGVLSTKWLYFRIKHVTDELQQMSIGSATKFLTKKILDAYTIPLPPIASQEYQSKLLWDIQNKIDLSSGINQTLEQMAQAIFKSWFVDFEPVKAKIAAFEAGGSEDDALLAAMQVISGKDPQQLTQLQTENPEHYKTLRATAELFPAAMQESELGDIPQGWGIGSFKDLCLTVESGGTPKRNTPEYWGGEIKWLASGEVRDVVVLDTKERITESGLKNSSAKLWPMYTTVVAMYGATAGQVCLIADQMTSNQACCGLIPKKNYRAFTFFSAKRSIQSLSEKASGSAQQNLNKGLVEGHPAILPSEAILVVYEDVAFPLMLKWIENMRESVMLAETRDTLLPKLLSGELTTQSTVEEGVL